MRQFWIRINFFFANYVFDKGLIPKIFKELTIHSYNGDTTIKKCLRELNISFPHRRHKNDPVKQLALCHRTVISHMSSRVGCGRPTSNPAPGKCPGKNGTSPGVPACMRKTHLCFLAPGFSQVQT